MKSGTSASGATPKRPRQKGTGTLVQRGERTWLLRYNAAPPGAPPNIQNETVHGTKREAEDRLRDSIALAKKGGIATKGTMTFSELAEQFIAAKRLSREETTANLYARDLRLHILPSIAGVKVRSLTPAHVDRLLASAVDTSKKVTKGQPLSWRGRRRLRTLLSSICEFGVRHDVIVKNICKQVETPAAAYEERKPLGIDDATTIISAARGTDLETLIIAAIGSGMRRGELCGLRVSDIDLESGGYSVRRAVKNVGTAVVVGKCKTRKSERSDVLPAFVLEVLKAHRLRQREHHLALGVRLEDPYVFDNGLGEPMNPNEVSRRFLDFIRAKSLRPCRFHDLRHLCATLSFAAGVPLKTISESLGHANIGITSTIYTHLLDGAMAAKSSALDSYVGDALKKAAKGR
jgi:integrase